MRKSIVAIIAFVLIASVSCGRLGPSYRSASAPRQPVNVILFIGDGMGPEQVKAASLYAGSPLSFERFPYHGSVMTWPVSNPLDVTDSAAAATAMATGLKVRNGVLSVAIPGDGRPLPTILEQFKQMGRSTGLVTTTYLTHATPAAFAAHVPSRDNNDQIAQDYLQRTQPDVMLGGGTSSLLPGAAKAAGYVVVTSRDALRSDQSAHAERLCGLFGNGNLPYEYDLKADGGDGRATPSLAEMTQAALMVLARNPNGFFLMIEGGRIDHAGHMKNTEPNKLEYNVQETLAFAEAVESVMAWARHRSDTLVIVTADHETGGLKVIADRGPGQLPDVAWGGTGHTGVRVPVYAWGVGADAVPDIMDNTEIYDLMARSLAPAAAAAAQ